MKIIATRIILFETKTRGRWNTSVPGSLSQSQTQTFISFDTKRGKFKCSQIAKFYFLLDPPSCCAHLVTGKHTSTVTKKH